MKIDSKNESIIPWKGIPSDYSAQFNLERTFISLPNMEHLECACLMNMLFVFNPRRAGTVLNSVFAFVFVSSIEHYDSRRWIDSNRERQLFKRCKIEKFFWERKNSLENRKFSQIWTKNATLIKCVFHKRQRRSMLWRFSIKNVWHVQVIGRLKRNCGKWSRNWSALA